VRARIVLAVGALGTLAAACGGASSPTTATSSRPSASLPPTQLLSDASAQLVAMQTARFAGSGSVYVPASGSASQGGQVPVSGPAYVTFTMSGAISKPTGRTEVTVSIHGLSIEELITMSALYLRVPQITATPNATAVSWFEIPASDLPSGSGLMPPAEQAAASLRSFVHPRVTGHAVVDGQPCTLVTATISGAQLERLIGASNPTFASSAGATALATTSATAVAAVNGSHELVQLTESVQGAAGIESHLVLTFTDQNQPVSIPLPPAGSVKKVNLGELSGILGGIGIGSNASTGSPQG